MGEGPLHVGVELELAGAGNRVTNFAEMPFENYARILEQVAAELGGDPSRIRRVDFEVSTSDRERYPSGRRSMFRAISAKNGSAR